ncbi:Cyclin-dependent kinase inhibitor [Heracleum sosnowskyi]|uniref:Cyclin-dependent kinase inhibitor n=1 Tax=Heracleum sosnowskyi TaxID=360622 RepID=A0AAD8JE97_9APIA|nr:Cyclin-dependent kinase inhibitor [Heracleum sosnowskyi]
MEVAAQMEVKTSVSNKRKRLHSGDAAAVLLQSSPDDSHATHCPVSVANLPENSVSSTKMCEDSDEVPGSSLGLMNQSIIKCPVSLDLKADEISLTSPGGFSNRETEELMESSETTTKKAKFSTSLAAVAKMPSTEEIEEFLAAAEKHEQRRFAEKYNYDIVKDVPLEGRYQWVCLKP